MLEGVTPILRVRSLPASIDYYTNILGFEVDWHQSGLGSVSRDRCVIRLCEGGQGNPGTWIWIGVDDRRAALRGDIRRRTIRGRMRCRSEDLDGNVLRFGSEPKEDQPFSNWRG